MRVLAVEVWCFPGDLVGWSRVQGRSLRCFSLRIWGGWLGSLVRERGGTRSTEEGCPVLFSHWLLSFSSGNLSGERRFKGSRRGGNLGFGTLMKGLVTGELYWGGDGVELRLLRPFLGRFGRERITVVRPVGGLRGRVGTSQSFGCVCRYCYSVRGVYGNLAKLRLCLQVLLSS